jgi:hypothetical protein
LAKQEALLAAEAAAVAAAAGDTETEAGPDGGGENFGQGNMKGDDAPDGGAPPPAAQ